MLAILGSARPSKNFKINKTHRHEPQSETRHKPSEQNQKHYYYDMNKKTRLTATVFHCHSLTQLKTINTKFFFHRLIIKSTPNEQIAVSKRPRFRQQQRALSRLRNQNNNEREKKRGGGFLNR